MGLLADARSAYHASICANILGHRRDSRVFNIADTSSATSVALAKGLADGMGYPYILEPPTGQAAGALFALATRVYLEQTLSLLNHLRPGTWVVSTAQNAIYAFDQYEHLGELRKLVKNNKELATALGTDYLVVPDIVVTRESLTDEAINAGGQLLDDPSGVANYTPLRSANRRGPVLLASISCKWTMRSDRAQNTRTEALNLIRNRKGPAPRIVAVTLEPLPSRLASIAMGTGDVDCTYHAALPELIAAADAAGFPKAVALLETLVAGRRLRDVSDLPLDLVV